MQLNPDALQHLLLPATPVLPKMLPHTRQMQAAVLLLVCAGAEPQTILTLRSSDLPFHAGQISLPGGRVAAEDTSLEATALREAHEETGLDPATVKLLGRLPTVLVNSSGFEITPVVGWTNSCPQLQADPREVAGIITCPLDTLLQPALYRRETLVSDGNIREFQVIYIGEHRVWGATAGILYSLACLLNPAPNQKPG